MSGLSQFETWRDQRWTDLWCPICARQTYGPEGNTYCGWHAKQVLMLPAGERPIWGRSET
jgi:hypothetical protein